MGQIRNPELLKVFEKAATGRVSLWNAFLAHGSPTSWGNCSRAYKAWYALRADTDGRGDTGGVSSSGGGGNGSRAASAPPSVQAASTSATPSVRTGAPLAVPTRSTSHQRDTAQKNKEAHEADYKRAHKGATAVYRPRRSAPAHSGVHLGQCLLHSSTAVS